MKKIIACIGTFFALVTLSTQAKNPYLLQTADRSAMEHWVDSVFETLSPKERIAQLLVITVRNSDTPQNRKTLQRLIQEQKIGGLLFCHLFSEKFLPIRKNFFLDRTAIPLFLLLSH